MPFTRSNHLASLLCFDDTSYFYDSGTSNRRCIAPTSSGKQCWWDIDETELSEALELIAEAETLPHGAVRTSVLERLVLLRVCGDQHREKLEAHAECLQKVAQRYALRIPTVRSGVERSPQSPRRSERASTPSTPGSPVRKDKWGKVRHNYQLRPREAGRAITNLAPSNHDVKKQTFVPYPAKPSDNIHEVLTSEVPGKYSQNGYVYAFSWPSNPDFIKVGFTSKSVEERISAWRECMPGAKLLLSVATKFPERMERLVHLQMAKVRHQIIICQQCARTHYEWFKTSTEEITQVINDWNAVDERDPLYTSTRELSKRWQKRITDTKDAITAQGLLKMLDVEEELARVKEAPVSVPESLLAVSKPKTSDGAVTDRLPESSTDKEATRAPIPVETVQETVDLILLAFNDFMGMLTLDEQTVNRSVALPQCNPVDHAPLPQQLLVPV